MNLLNELCPTCKGAKVLTNPLKKKEVQTCHTCNGNGYIPTEQVQWILDGRALQAFRLQAQMHVHTFAEKMGIKPAELTDMEYGRRQPIDMMEVATRL